jgi:hypothetical protein
MKNHSANSPSFGNDGFDLTISEAPVYATVRYIRKIQTVVIIDTGRLNKTPSLAQ